MKTALTIAGSDSSGGAGIQADLKTFSAHGVFGMSVIASVTAQNTQGVTAVEDMSPKIIDAQLDAIFTDIKVDAVKIGMVSNSDAIKVIADKLKSYRPRHVVLDPVMVSKSGYDLLQPDAKQTLISDLIPLAGVVTPNLREAAVLTDMRIEGIEGMERAAKAIYHMGSASVLVKGGHLKEEPVDILYDGSKLHHYKGERIHTKNTHGTGCTLSSAIASNLAKGLTLDEAIMEAKRYIHGAIKNSFSLGGGVGPTNHFYQWFGERV
ncbi:hydroxymethylpyrimidine/phosphomethylpyrimidine kinase [Scopulibacillus darangshiensis]|uniref:Hydroxymethylpyrimidine/phosphomethylpyrimidine kinase n=1 Tax=Scopulibacillus darangshiensis TaxID=442528 RepID=A0A4R2NSI3_9BACL|nr:bifunctional hydroxymethylpyrimidine kinase/phosphomethylpyrimidine kinase [Scopulibacillus darangshiensis]TCP24511.1 hydroxymethylpyrimidine/phosphomethylpyrimidine kinase [Scopulibacillus darangshiensis]